MWSFGPMGSNVRWKTPAGQVTRRVGEVLLPRTATVER
jgi:hypothetical protein